MAKSTKKKAPASKAATKKVHQKKAIPKKPVPFEWPIISGGFIKEIKKLKNKHPELSFLVIDPNDDQYRIGVLENNLKSKAATSKAATKKVHQKKANPKKPVPFNWPIYSGGFIKEIKKLKNKHPELRFLVIASNDDQYRIGVLENNVNGVITRNISETIFHSVVDEIK